jgi:hypothetical protein
MYWKQMSIYRMESPEGYIISKSKVNEKASVYIARAPKTTPIIFCGYDETEAKEACEEHLRKVGKP